MLVCLGSWGFLMHKTATKLAVYELPKKMQKFFVRNINSVVNNSIRPDIRRNTDFTEAPKHFIDLENYGDSSAWKMPLKWDDAVKIYTKDSLLKYGYVPYYVIVMKDNLARAFREKNKDSILFYAADMAHYIEDANVPLHTTNNYDGQLTNQTGIHALWESTVPEIELSNINFYPKHHAIYLSHPEEAIWGAVRKAHSLLNEVFEEEKQVSKDFTDSTKYHLQKQRGKWVKKYSDEFAKAYAQVTKQMVNERLIASANLVADFWFTAWVDAGKPDLNNLISPAWNKSDKKQLKKDLKLFKTNKLIQPNQQAARPTE